MSSDSSSVAKKLSSATTHGVRMFGFVIPAWLAVCRTTCRSAANAKIAFERTTAARSRGRSPRRRGTSPPPSGQVWRSSAATAGSAAHLRRLRTITKSRSTAIRSADAILTATLA